MLSPASTPQVTMMKIKTPLAELFQWVKAVDMVGMRPPNDATT
jgi:hypothetical protein